MATNAFNELMAEVNAAISEANTATSNANGAATQASEAAQEANTAGSNADTAAAAANAAAATATAEANKWAGATVGATTLAAGSEATMAVGEQNGVKHFTFGIPRGADGATGATGAQGDSGVTFRLSGTNLYITTN